MTNCGRCGSVIVIVTCLLLLEVAIGQTSDSEKHRALRDGYLSPSKRRLALTVQEHLFNDRFGPAHNVADSLIAEHPEDPLGRLYHAAVHLAWMTDAEDDSLRAPFETAVESVLVLADSFQTEQPRGVAWMYLCRGHAYAYRSLWESRFGSFTSAISHAFKARSAYEGGLKADSMLYDLHGGLGMYHYWKSAKAGFLRWLRIFKNEKDRGIEELYLAVDSSDLSQDLARNALVWIWLDMEAYESAIAMCQQMLRRYPEGKLFLWPLAEAYFEKEAYRLSAETYLKLREKLLVDPGNYYNLVECDYQLYRGYDRSGRKREAVLAARRITEYYQLIPEKTKRRQRSKIDYLRRKARAETGSASH